MKVLGVIPARGGSRGIPRKNLAELGGRPLLAWTIEASLQSSLERVVLSTDDPEIAALGRELGAEVPFLRPPELASDHANSIDVLIHTIDALGESYDAVMLLQPTSPFRSSTDIDAAIEQLASTGADSVWSVVEVGEYHPARMRLLRDGELVDPGFSLVPMGTRRQDLPPIYVRNGAVYVVRIETLRNNSIEGNRCMGLVMPPDRSVDINSEFDLILANSLVKDLHQNPD